MKRFRIAIVEPSIVVAEGIESILRRSAEYDVVCNVRSWAEFEQHRSADVDVVLLSLQYAHEDVGTMAKIGIQTALAEVETLRKFSAVVSLYSTHEELFKVLREVADTPHAPSYSDSHELSERERDVLVLVAKGYTNKEIATKLFISPHTVISHRKNIVHKTGIRSVAGLTVYAVLNKLIDSEQL